MYTYALLEPQCYYLLQEKEDEGVILIKVNMETDLCLLVTAYGEVAELSWKKKSDPIHEIIECLSDDKVKEWELAYRDSQNAYYEEEDDE